MRRFLTIMIAALLGTTIVYALLRAGASIPDESVLVLEIAGGIDEKPPVDTLQRIMAGAPALPTLVLQLEKAAIDKRIQGVLLHVRALDAGYTKLEELRQAIQRFRKSEKPVVALLDLASLNATREVYLASAASRAYVVPGFLGAFAGVAGQSLYFGGFLSKLGIKVEYERIGKYKSAPEMFAQRSMSEPSRRVLNELLDGIFDEIVTGVAAGRSLDPDRVRKLFDETPSTAEEYISAGLADGIASRAQVLDQAGLGNAQEVDMNRYVRIDPRHLGLRAGPSIGLIFGEGTIVQSAGRDPLRTRLDADSISDALKAAGEDDDIAAIVLRIDSGGGDSLASDEIWLKIREVREQKPVVVSMGQAAASGAYYLASAADKIVAQPLTLTGSIGIFVLRPALGGLFRKLEIGSEVFSRGAYSSVSLADSPLTPHQRKRTRAFIHSLYETFLQRVSTGRGLSTAEVDRLGQGRIWLGETALARGLVDTLGGLHEAVKLAQSEAGLDSSVDPVRVIFPGPRTLSEQVSELLRNELPARITNYLLPTPLPAIVRAAASLTEGEIAYLPPYWLEVH